MARPSKAGIAKNSNVPDVTRRPSNRSVPSPVVYSTSRLALPITESNTWFCSA